MQSYELNLVDFGVSECFRTKSLADKSLVIDQTEKIVFGFSRKNTYDHNETVGA